MQVFLEAIQFNHDPNSATTDALNIRKNETEFVTLPEWQRGVSFNPEDSPAAYAIRETRGNQITIQAKFKCTGTDNKVRVRAVDARARRNNLGCSPIGSLLRMFSWTRSAQAGNVLGQVKEREIAFIPGKTCCETFELQNVRLWRAGVSVSNTEWRWQFRAKPSDHWTDFAVTRHRIYTILEVPKCPWEQTPYDDCNSQLPWANALEYACDWAAGARDPDHAASLVTQNVNDLGLRGVTYTGSSLYSCPNFNCTQFLDLLRGGTGVGAEMNCSDCATAVSSFANLLGCNLKQLLIGPCSFNTKQIKLLGYAAEGLDKFFGHEVAWKGAVNEDGRLFDACLQLDGDDQPEAPPFEALLPSNIPFGKTGERHYRFRLSPKLVLLPDTLTCRKIGYSVESDCRSIECVEFLKGEYGYDKWIDIASEKYLGSANLSLLEQAMRSEWRLKVPVPQPKYVNSVQALQALAFFPTDKDVLLRLDLVEWSTSQEAREFMLRQLGEFRLLHVKRLLPPIGDISFVEAREVSILFTRSQFMLLVRSVGRKPVPVRETATRIDKLLVETAWFKT